MQTFISINRLSSFFYFVFLFSFYLCSCKAKNFQKGNNLYDLIDSLYSDTQIKLHGFDSISYKNGSSDSSATLFFGKIKLGIEKNGQGNIEAIKINNILLDSIQKGNVQFQGDLEEMNVELSDIRFFELKSQKFFIINMSIKNCIGSFCRAAISLLVSYNGNSTHGYFFCNAEIKSVSFFRMDHDKLIYLNVTNSFTNENQFNLFNQCKDQKCLLYKINAIELDNNKWDSIKNNKDEEYFIVIKVKSQFDVNNYKIIQKNWP